MHVHVAYEDLKHDKELTDDRQRCAHFMSDHLHDSLLLLKFLLQQSNLFLNEALFQLHKMTFEAFEVDVVSLHLVKDGQVVKVAVKLLREVRLRCLQLVAIGRLTHSLGLLILLQSLLQVLDV